MAYHTNSTIMLAKSPLSPTLVVNRVLLLAITSDTKHYQHRDTAPSPEALKYPQPRPRRKV